MEKEKSFTIFDGTHDSGAADTICIGMHRSPFEASVPTTAFFVCPCGSFVSSRQSFRDHWQQGHLDYPIYVTKAEVLGHHGDPGEVGRFSLGIPTQTPEG
jgi:hypothetical protein